MDRPDQDPPTATGEDPRPPGTFEDRVGTAVVDGVQVRFGDSPGRLRAVLTFRVGAADEELPIRGVTHLVEHLALAETTLGREAYNGWVTDVTTSFAVAGDPDEVRDFLRATTAALAALPMRRLATEVRVLQTEDQGRGRSLPRLASGLRFGARRHGLVAAGDLGLPALDEATVLHWARRFFTRGNATLWLSGAPPEGLDLSALPTGDRVPAPAVEPLDQELPAWTVAHPGAVAVSMIGARTAAFATGVRVLEQRLHRRLRRQEGLSYEIGANYERWTADDAEVLVYADAQPDDTDAVQAAIAEELHRICDSGATEREIADEIARRAKERSGEDTPEKSAGWRADELLLTGVEPSEAELAQEYAELRPAGVARAMALAARTAIWLVPPGHGVADRRVQVLADDTYRPADGRPHKRIRGVVRELADDRLFVGDAEVGITAGDGSMRTIRYADVVALQVWSDDGRTLWAVDGTVLFVHPAAWRGGPDAVAAIDAAIPASVVVRTGESSGYDVTEDLRPRRFGRGAGS